MDTNNPSEKKLYRQEAKTIVFTDLVDSVNKKIDLGQVGALEMEQAHYDMLCSVIKRFKDGEMKQNEGDSYSFIFENPNDAIVFAFKAQEEQKELRKKYPKLHKFRIGINTGGVFFVRNVVRGLSVDLTARIMNLGDGDQILCSELDHIDLIEIEGKLNKKIIKKDHGFYKEKGSGKYIKILELGEKDTTKFKKPDGNPKIWRADEWLGYDDSFQKELVIVFTNFEFSLKLKNDPNANEFFNEHRKILLDSVKQFRESRIIHKGFDFHVFIFSQKIEAVKFAISARKEHDKLRQNPKYSKLPNFCVGIHTGSINVKRQNEQVEIWGIDVDLTKDIIELAKDGKIFCSEEILNIIKNKISYKKFSSYTQKEIKRDITVYEVLNINE